MEVAAYQEPSVLGRKRAFGAHEASDAKGEVSIFSAAGNMADTESVMKVLRQRFKSELLAVHGLRDKAKKIKPSPPPPMIKRRKIKAASPPSPPVIKRSKIKAASPPPPPVIKRSKKVTREERQLLMADLEKLILSELPHRIRDLLEKQSHAVRDGYMEMDMATFDDEAILELRKQLDEFLRESRQEGSVIAEEVDIVGGVSPLPPFAPVSLPLAEDEDTCGDASPEVVTQKNLGDDKTLSASGSPCSSTISDSSQAECDATLLMASAKESLARCRAREKARQDVLRTERMPRHMTTETIHPALLNSLGIVEYDYHRAIPYTLLPQLGLFLKDDGDEEEDLEQGEILDDLEEGEIGF
ncbi:hypothetical protein ACQ4PT_001879 [Festuca glaucescens]